MELKFNWLAIVVSTLICILVPFVWYMESLFGKAWKELSGLQEEELKKDFGPAIAVAAAASGVQAFALAGFLNYLGSQTFGQGALAGIQLWLGFTATALITDYRFSRKPWKLAFISTLR